MGTTLAFSSNGEYVAASTFNNHELYIWERGHGSLVRMLEGPKEEQGRHRIGTRTRALLQQRAVSRRVGSI